MEVIGTGQSLLRLAYRQTEEMGFSSDGPAIDTFEVTVLTVQ